MNDIQKNYLIGLIIKKVNTYDLESIREVNLNNSEYVKNIQLFVEENAANEELIEELIIFVDNEEPVFGKEELTIEKIGLYVSVKKDDQFFIIGQSVFKDLLITTQSYMSKYLPLGSVVKLKNTEDSTDANKDTLVVIEQRMVHQKGTDYFYDYRAVPYPMGIFNEQMYINFLIKDIDEVIFEGYTDPENEGYELALKESLIGSNVFSKKYQSK